jgi:hypothetical protein
LKPLKLWPVGFAEMIDALSSEPVVFCITISVRKLRYLRLGQLKVTNNRMLFSDKRLLSELLINYLTIQFEC